METMTRESVSSVCERLLEGHGEESSSRVWLCVSGSMYLSYYVGAVDSGFVLYTRERAQMAECRDAVGFDGALEAVTFDEALAIASRKAGQYAYGEPKCKGVARAALTDAGEIAVQDMVYVV